MIKGYVNRKDLIEACQECHNREEGRIHMAEVPPDAVVVDGTVGQDLHSGVMFVTSEAIPKSFKRLSRVKLIILPETE